jgi:hypothetical protein
MPEPSDSFVAAIDNFSLADLRKERENLQIELQNKKLAVDRASREYSFTQRSLQIVDMVIGLREEQTPQNLTFRPVGNPPEASMGQSESVKPKTAISGTPGTGKTGRMLELLKLSRGMAPGELYKALLAEGCELRRQYVTTALQRMVRRGEVTHDKDEGKYYAVSDN